VIETYRKRFAKDAEAMKVLETIFDEVKNSRAKSSGNNKEAGFFDAVDDAAKFARWRNTLLERLAKK
jgi:hypothetical protein